MFIPMRCLILVLSWCGAVYVYVLTSTQLSGLSLRSIVVLVLVLSVQFNQNFETSVSERFTSLEGMRLVFPFSQSTEISNPLSVVCSLETSSVKSTRFASTTHNSFSTTCLYRIHILLLISLVNGFDTRSLLDACMISDSTCCCHRKPRNRLTYHK